MIRILTISLCAITLSCKRQTQVATNVHLAPNQWASVSVPAVEVRGEFNTVCSSVGPQYQQSMGDSAFGVLAPGSKIPVTLQMRAVTTIGDTVEFPRFSIVMADERGLELCLERRHDPKGRRYTNFQFLANDSLTLRDVRWWSGRKSGFI